MGFTKPLLEQFTHYLADVVRGDLGTSWQTTRPVTEDLFQRFRAMLEQPARRQNAAGDGYNGDNGCERDRLSS